MSIWPDTLVRDIARRKCVLVIGSGVSRHARSANGLAPPTWKSFLLNACKGKGNTKNIKDAIQNGDYLHACEWLKRRYGSEWGDYLRMVFSHPKFEAGKIHKEIFSLDSRIIFSMNFDDIYERYANAFKRGTIVTKNYYDKNVAEFLRGSERYVIKVHGTLNNTDNLIFTQREYSQARVSYAGFYKAFDAALMSHTFLFLGAGYTDPDLNLMLENQSFSFPSQKPHYILSSGEHKDLVQSLRENRNLEIIIYKQKDENHSGLVEELEKLNTKVEAERYRIAKEIDW